MTPQDNKIIEYQLVEENSQNSLLSTETHGMSGLLENIALSQYEPKDLFTKDLSLIQDISSSNDTLTGDNNGILESNGLSEREINTSQTAVNNSGTHALFCRKNSNASVPQINIPSNHAITMKPLNDRITSYSFEKKDLKSPPFVGFRTASNKPLPTLSAKAQQKAHSVLSDLDAEDSFEIKDNGDHSIIKEGSVLDITTEDCFSKDLNKRKDLALLTPDSPKSTPSSLRSFMMHAVADDDHTKKTSPGKPTYLCHGAKDPLKQPPVSQMNGFTTGGGKSLKPVSEKAHQNALLSFALSEAPPAVESPKGVKRPAETSSTDYFMENGTAQAFIGFRTGTGKKSVALSAEAIQRAEALLKDTCVPPKTLSLHPSQTTHSFHPPSPSYPMPEDRVHGQSLSSTLDISFNHYANKRRSVARGVKTKPFISPVINSKISMTKAAIYKTTSLTVVASGQSVFNLTDGESRQPLSTLGKPLLHNAGDLISLGVSLEIIEMTMSSARHTLFGSWGPAEAEKQMIAFGASSHSLSKAWVENHYGWIVWKIACMIRSYPHHFQHWWNSKKILDQLLYRYEREINLGQRSVLKRIIEKDDVATKHMVLVVADIIPLHHNKYRLLLTDGWYQIEAVMDPRMERAIEKKRLKIGQKLSISGAQLLGDNHPKSPLSATGNTHLAIASNGCLPAAWDTRLGYHPQKGLTRSLSSLFSDGGMVTMLDVVVYRKYPLMHTEIFPNGSSITRMAQEEDLLSSFESSAYPLLSARTGRQGETPLSNDHGEEENPPFHHSSFSSMATDPPEKKISTYFKLTLCDHSSDFTSSHAAEIATLLVSNANEMHHMDICEGVRYRIFFVLPYTPKSKWDSKLHFKTVRSTRWEVVPGAPGSNYFYGPREVTPCDSVCYGEPFSEIDMVGLVLSVGEAVPEKVVMGQPVWSQTFIITDDSKGLCQIKRRSSAKPLRYTKGQLIGITNVRYSVYDPKYDITHVSASNESEVFLKQPGARYMQRAILQLQKWIQSHPNEVNEVMGRIHRLTGHTSSN